MRTKLFFALLMTFALSAPTAFGAKSEAKELAAAAKVENKLSAEEVKRLTTRVEEIRDMDKTNMTASEKSELRKELKATKKNVRDNGGYVYVSVGTILLIILLVVLLV